MRVLGKDTTVVRIPIEMYEEAEKLRKEFLEKPCTTSNPFTIVARGGPTGFIGGLLGYAISKLRKGD